MMKNFFKKIVVYILTLEAKRVLNRYKPNIIAITGNVGKTSTKDAVYAVVSAFFDTRKSLKSMNSEIGLPLTILGLENAWGSAFGWAKNILKGLQIAFFGNTFPKWLVLEIGADHPGDIEKVSEWLHPDIVVLTRMSSIPVHIEFFENVGEVLREKMFLAEALKPNGTLIVNADDELFLNAVNNLSTNKNINKITFGSAKNSDVRITESGVLYDESPFPLPLGQYAVFDTHGRTERINLVRVIGNHLIYPVAAALAVAHVLNIKPNLENIFKTADMPRGRMRLLSGRSNSVIIDDTYNSSPIACEEALKTLARLSVRGKKIAVLADMKELGSYSTEAHREIGKLAGEIVHTLVTVGKEAENIAVGARESLLSADRILSFNNSIEATDKFSEILRAGDVVLIKGSQSMRMEKLVAFLLIDPSKASELLVRQEEEWKVR